jgi:DNA recombination-dependent growth factor C
MNFYQLDVAKDSPLLTEEFWQKLAAKNELVPFSDLPEKIAQGLVEVNGFAPVDPKLNESWYALHIRNFTVIKLCNETKKVKPAVLTRTISRMEKKLLDESGMDFLSKDQKKNIKQLALNEELKRAVEDRSESYIAINRKESWIVISESSKPKCEKIITKIRGYAGTLPAIILNAPLCESIFTAWVLKGSAPEGVHMTDQCRLFLDESVTTYKKQVISKDEEVVNNIKHGKEVNALSFLIGSYDDSYANVSFTLDSHLKVTGMKFKINKDEFDNADVKSGIDASNLIFFSFVADIYAFIADKLVNYEVPIEEFS